MQAGLVKYVHELCRGYDIRQREISRGDLGRPTRAAVLAEYARLNNVIDNALLLVESEVLRAYIKRALIEGTGHPYTYGCPCGYHQFYAHKRRVTAEIARLMLLAE